MNSFPTVRKVARVVVVAAAILLLIRVWPRPSLRTLYPRSTGVWSYDGQLLRATLAGDDQFRLWVPLSQVSPFLVKAFLLKEDRWFYWHPGVNPVSVVRAARRSFLAGDRQGGSTVSMQLARLSYRLNTRTVSGKLRQMCAALWLEARYSKRELLEAYLNVLPFGGNNQGVEVASRVYFGKPAGRITLGEALTLAVIPQHPSGRAGKGASDSDLLAARRKLGQMWLARDGGNEDTRRQVDLAVPLRSGHGLPWLAPHFVDTMLPEGTPGDAEIRTTLDLGLQRLVESQIQRYLARYGESGLRNAAALLVDWREMSVKAWIGSADFWNEDIDGQVNGVLAKRSPGSALKPFVYALGLDQGVLHPQTVLRDAPVSFGPFAPENFDGRFSGPITAEEALIRSRNIPAVWVATQLARPNLHQFLQSAGVRDLKPESFYGLALPLGGGEITMEEVAVLYAMLANHGLLRPLRLRQADPRPEGVRLLSAEASFVTLDMLRQNPRPDSDGTAPRRTHWPVAWKTGTSWGFRDAWSAGVVGGYVLVVWIGNFDGRGNPAFVGVDAAAPLFFRIADSLNLARPDEEVPPIVPPPGVAKVAVCIGSGDLPNADCPATVDTWYIPGKSPIKVSQLHRAVAMDARTGKPVCPPYPASTVSQVFEFWSSDLLSLFREAGVPRRTPPALPGCATDERLGAPRIVSPTRDLTYAIRSSRKSEQIPLAVWVAADVQRVFWFDGKSFIGTRRSSESPLPWVPAVGGMHLIRVVDDRGRSAEREVEVELNQ